MPEKRIRRFTVGYQRCRISPPVRNAVIYLFQSGGPRTNGPLRLQTGTGKAVWRGSTTEHLSRRTQDDDEFGTGQFPLLRPALSISNDAGQAGSWISDALPHIGSMADDLCIIRSMHTDAINHDPAITFQQTGSQIPGRPQHRFMGRLWLGQQQRQSAGIRSDEQPGYRQDGSTSVRPLVG